ncbi:hypothetical protein J2T08_005520 [Neorhizobium galegae]|uniref:hypothetical protein n=1 Tax=Neorhizobium galegae TaxID=399 RepID=UPI0027843BE1|nr:hypothetical protein [Neorhizobium galegae]MDQ0137576.1 hypothetical protein [Neorhizobium galegae]
MRQNIARAGKENVLQIDAFGFPVLPESELNVPDSHTFEWLRPVQYRFQPSENASLKLNKEPKMSNSKTLFAAAALLAFPASGAAIAEGDYYQGLAGQQVTFIDPLQTSNNSDRNVNRSDFLLQTSGQTIDSGDYYHGASRPI